MRFPPATTASTALGEPWAELTRLPSRPSMTAAISTPTRSRSAAASSPSELAVNTTARSPGLTPHRLIRRRAAPEVTTPGRSFPANT